ncbi:hypothetical protein [Hyphomicrobium sp. ghe19]|uniref:hypothetical protein n=1 Tax=Hyphomicrobium sp. ghe19 TaxID=2682968 RepID=UPI001366FE55|nr:hypothetical protein HYPP_02393 [Hyphomicrobium sp. ghe19]
MTNRNWAVTVLEESQDALKGCEAKIGRRLSNTQRDVWFEGFRIAAQLVGQGRIPLFSHQPQLYLVKS